MAYCRIPGDTENEMHAAFARDARLHPDIDDIATAAPTPAGAGSCSPCM
jgi:hypothetical protein